YALWYSVLPFMQATTAATVQLTVPAITAAAGVLIAGESLDARLLVAFLLIIGGVAVFIRSASKKD
ncbi:EamA family transporter, partial [Thalassolituus sp. UBA6592]